jgi:phage terminase large subunit-like protein
MAWDTSCRDWGDRLRSGRSLVPDLPLDQDAARRAAGIFDALRLPDVPGQPRMKEAAGDWQRDIVKALFGSVVNGQRQIREAFVLVPKKNSKTTAGAAIMLTALLVNQRPRAEFLLIAPTQEIADLAFSQAVGMIEADPVLASKFHVQSHLKRISYRQTKAFLKVKSFDPKVVTGTKPAGILLDETHVIAEAPDADRVIGQLRGGLISQPEGFLVQITTQSERPPAGVFAAELSKARKVRDGTLSAPLLPVLYEFPDGVDWQDPSNWHLVTPNNGRSITVERLIPDYEAAREASEAELRRWASQHLNVQIGVALRSDGWAGAQFWIRGNGGPRSLDELLDRAEVATVGIDGGGLDDLFGFAVIARERDTRRWLLWAHALISPEGLDRRKANAALYSDFARDGDLTVVDGLPGDLEWIKAHVGLVLDAGCLAMVGADPAGIGGAVDALAEIGVSEETKLLVGVPQGIRLMNAAKTVERKLVDGSLKHSGSRLLAWCAGNAKVRATSTAMMIERAASGYGKIDPLMASFNAAHLMTLNPTVAGPAAAWAMPC